MIVFEPTAKGFSVLDEPKLGQLTLGFPRLCRAELDLGTDEDRLCGRIVLGQGAKVLSGSTQGIYPRHHGS